MQNTHADKARSTFPISNSYRDGRGKGISMPAVPVLQQKEQPVSDDGVIQAVKFGRWLSAVYYNDQETKLIAKEKQVIGFFNEMVKYNNRFPELQNVLLPKILNIRDSTVQADEIENTNNQLDAITVNLDRISSKIAFVGVKGDDRMMEAYGKNAENTKVGKIIQIYLNTISVLPPIMDTEKNRQAIKEAIHPDAENTNIGYTDDYLGDSDVELAQKRHRQIVTNLYGLYERVQNDWKDLQTQFGLEGKLKGIALTGSDLHKGGQQVVIIEAEGGQQVVYKPRSTAPDAALTDSKDGIFAALNKKGANLPTMKYHESKDKGSYVEFIKHQSIKTGAEIKSYYFGLGQLAVAAKLFGVNDLHYENIMATSHGPAIIDGETSFLMNVMTKRDFQSNELQVGIFKHVSEIDQKLSNNSFYTLLEKKTWDETDANGRPGWDKYIGDIRDMDVKSGGKYEQDLKDGIKHILDIIKKNRVEIAKETTETIKSTDEVRVVPIATTEFKKLMGFYRDHKRYDNERGMDNAVRSATEEVTKSLTEKGYKLHNSRSVKMLINEDFAGGDIPIIHYNGSKDQLVWNDRIIGSYNSKESPKKVVDKNIKWVLSQTVDQITGSLQG
jgi:molybdopterin converting factor small subunit